MRLVILQPFYLPYSGVFEQVRHADKWVIYDDVQFVRRNWQSRNKIKTQNGTRWLTVPVQHDRGQAIVDAEIADQHWRDEHWSAIHHAYARAPHHAWVEENLRAFYERDWSHLAELNVETFMTLCDMVEVGAEFIRSSEHHLPGSGTERILNYCLELGASNYLSGPSARNYLDEESFADRGIELEYFDFEHPTYSQLHGEFVPYLSVIDLLANEGPRSGEVLVGHGTPVPAGDYSDE